MQPNYEASSKVVLFEDPQLEGHINSLKDSEILRS